MKDSAAALVISTACSHFQIQIWLAMAYDANRRHKDCIALYKSLEKTHPMISIRKQAADFRYIAEAPKLKISNDEVVTIPQIGSSWDWLVISLTLHCFLSPSLCLTVTLFSLHVTVVWVGWCFLAKHERPKMNTLFAWLFTLPEGALLFFSHIIALAKL